MMTKRCTFEWQSSVKQHDVLDVDVAVTNWGRTSWTLGFVGTCEGRPVFTAEMVYVSVKLGENVSMVTPDAIRSCLGDAVDLFDRGNRHE